MKGQKRLAVLLAAALGMTACGGGPADTVSSLRADLSSGLKAASLTAETNQPTQEDAVFVQVVSAVAPVSERFVATGALSDGVTPEENQTILEAASTVGAPVMAMVTLRGQGMQNYDSIKQFCDDAASGKDGETTYYEIALDGVQEYRLTAKDGKITVTRRTWFCGENGPDDESVQTEAFDNIALWDNGWMVLSRNEGDGTTYTSGNRVIPLPDRVIGLYEKYVRGVDFAQDHVLTWNWDASDTSPIRWEFLYGGLLNAEGKDLGMYEPAEGADSEGPWLVPAADFEGRLTAYFPVTAQELRKLPNYRADTQSYAIEYFRGSGAFLGGLLEVTDVTQNEDGSMTLRVDWVGVPIGEELRGRYYLTVLPEDGGGYRYLGNRVDDTVRDTPS